MSSKTFEIQLPRVVIEVGTVCPTQSRLGCFRTAAKHSQAGQLQLLQCAVKKTEVLCFVLYFLQ